MKPKRSILILFTACFIFSYVIYDLVLFFKVSEQKILNNHSEIAAKILRYHSVAKSLLESNHIRSLETVLSSLKKDGVLSFYILRDDGEVVFYANNNGDLSSINFDYRIIDQLLITEKMMVVTSEVGTKKITIGHVRNSRSALAKMFEEGKYILFADILIVISLASFLSFYFQRDLGQVLRSLRQTHRNVAGIATRSAEADTLQRGLMAYDGFVTDLAQENLKLKNQVLPALQSELRSSQTPPYEFKCTLVRTDINGFSSIFANHPTEVFMGHINAFFQEASQIVSRYNGLVYEFVGDEVIFYFKDEVCGSSAMAALSAVRDLGVAAEKIHQRTLANEGYPFTVKSSLSYGILRFGLQVHNYSLAGSPLIETVRILSEVHEKQENVVLFDQHIAAQVERLAMFSVLEQVKLKGVPEVKTLHAYKQHHPLRVMLHNLSPHLLSQIRFYRSNEDLLILLEFLRSERGSQPQEIVFALMGAHRDLRMYEMVPTVRDAYVTYINELVDAAQSSDRAQDYFILCAAIRFGESLFPKNCADADLLALGTRCLELENRRTVANSLEFLAYIESDADPVSRGHLLKHSDNRVRANALVHEATQELKSQHLKSLKKMLTSKDPYYVASALYSLGEIASHYKQKDPVFYSTNLVLLKQVEGIAPLLNHDNEMVRRQALLAAKKIGDESLKSQIQKLHAQAPSTSLGAEIEKLYFNDTPPHQRAS